MQVEVAEHEEAHYRNDGTDPEAPMHVLESDIGRVVGLGAYGVGRNDRAQDAYTAHEERKDDADMSEGRETQDHRRHDRDLIGLEDIGGHSGAVSDIVSDVVRYGRRVARIVLRYILLDFADEVGADVGCLGVYAAAHAHEECEQGAAEAEAEQGFVGLLAVHEENEGAAQKTEPVGQHARDRACAIAQLKRAAVARARGRRDPQIAVRGQAHADEADEPAEAGADDEGPGPPEVEPGIRTRGREIQQNGDDDHEGRDLLELSPEVCVRALANCLGDFLHFLRALVGPADLTGQHEGVQESGHGDGQHDEERDALEAAEAGVCHEREGTEALGRA